MRHYEVCDTPSVSIYVDLWFKKAEVSDQSSDLLTDRGNVAAINTKTSGTGYCNMCDTRTETSSKGSAQ